MTDRHRKAVNLDLPIAEVLDAYLDAPESPQQQVACSVALFIYFMLSEEGRAAAHSFYEYWKRGRPPRFFADPAPPFPPSIVLDFAGEHMLLLFLRMLRDDLIEQAAVTAEPLFDEPAAKPAAEPAPPQLASAAAPPAPPSGNLPEGKSPTRPAEKPVSRKRPKR